MLQTTNYQLSQWAPEDRILRADFNGDNAKIDAAIQAARDAIPMVKLADVTTAKAAVQVDLDVSGFDISTLRNIEIQIELPPNPYSSYTTIFLRLNGISTGYHPQGETSNSGAIASIDYGTSSATLCAQGFLLYLGNRFMGRSYGGYVRSDGCFSVSHEELFSLHTLAPENLTTLNLVSDASRPIPAGTKLRVYGVKK